MSHFSRENPPPPNPITAPLTPSSSKTHNLQLIIVDTVAPLYSGSRKQWLQWRHSAGDVLGDQNCEIYEGVGLRRINVSVQDLIESNFGKSKIIWRCRKKKQSSILLFILTGISWARPEWVVFFLHVFKLLLNELPQSEHASPQFLK